MMTRKKHRYRVVDGNNNYYYYVNNNIVNKAGGSEAGRQILITQPTRGDIETGEGTQDPAAHRHLQRVHRAWLEVLEAVREFLSRQLDLVCRGRRPVFYQPHDVALVEPPRHGPRQFKRGRRALHQVHLTRLLPVTKAFFLVRNCVISKVIKTINII